MIQSEIDIILNDNILQDINTETVSKYNNIYQQEMPETTIVKFVYKEHNGVFLNRANSIHKPKCKCIFTLHTGKKSSYVEIFDRENVNIFLGNSLWRNGSCKTEAEHLIFIKLLHSVKDVINKYDA